MKSATMRWILCFVFVCVFVTKSPIIVFADTDNEIIKVGYFDLKGMISQNEQGKFEGYTVDYLNKIAEKTGWKYEYIEDSWVSLLNRLERGELDLVCNAQYTTERAKLFSYSKFSIVDEFCVLYARKNDDRYCYNEIKAFDGMRVGAIEGTYQTKSFLDYAKRNNFSCDMVLYGTTGEVFEALDKGYVDAVTQSIQQNFNDTKIIAKFDALPSYFIVSKGKTSVIDKINKAVEEIKIDYPFFENKVYYKHFRKNEVESQMSLTRQELEFVQNSGVINVAVPIDRRPLAFLDRDDNELKGIMVDSLKLLEQEIGLRFNFLPMEMGQTGLEAIETPMYNMVLPVSDTPAYRYSEEIALSEKIMQTSLGIMTVGDEIFNINENHNIAIPESLVGTQSKLQVEYPNLNIIKFVSNEECVQALKSGRVDAIVNNVYVLNYLLQDPHYEGISMVPNVAISIPYCVGVCTDLPKEIISIVNKGIYTISKRELEQIVINYTINNEYDYTFSDYIYKNRTLILVIILFVTLIMVIFIFHNRQKITHCKVVENKNAELVKANIAKTEFLSRMSHEIRTPLGVIMGMNDIINQNTQDCDCVKDSSDKIKIASAHLLQIINDVLDMSKISEGKMELAHDVFNLEDEMKVLDTVYSTAAKQKGIVLKTKINLQSQYFIGDILRIKQIIINLLSNAIKYNKSDGEVSLSVDFLLRNSDYTKQIIRFSVQDTGMGIKPESLETIFLAFEREKSFKTSKVSGTGLGLSISSEIVKLMGSKINVESILGDNSRFWFDLELPVASTKDIEKQSKKEVDFSKLRLNGLRCLVVDDNMINTAIVKRLLESTGAIADTADNGLKACEIFEKSPEGHYFAILMDIRMPVMDGHEAAKYIRSLDRGDSHMVKIIALSANAFKEDKEKSLKCGMNAHCSKPIEKEQIMEALLE